MRRPVALLFGLTIAIIVQIHCNGDVGPGHNRANDLGKEVVQLKTALKHMKRQLYHVMDSLRDFQKVTHDCQEALEKAQYKAQYNFISSPLQLELQSMKREQNMLNMSVSATRQDMLSTRSDIIMVAASVNVTDEDVLSMKTELSLVKSSLKDAELDIMSTKSDMKMVQASVNATDNDALSMKSELTQVQTSLTDAERDILSTKSAITAIIIDTSLNDVLQKQGLTTSRLSAMEKRIVQVENAKNIVGVSCLDGFLRHEDSCYWFSTFKETFTSAKSFCESMRSHLANITSKSENNFMKNYASQTGEADYYWIGGSLRDVDLNGDWIWEGGSPMVYTDWGPGEPNNVHGQELCVDMAKHLGCQWNDGPCQYKANFICQASYF